MEYLFITISVVCLLVALVMRHIEGVDRTEHVWTASGKDSAFKHPIEPSKRTTFDSECHAIQFSDRIVCDLCGIAWDTNDPGPPRCRIPWMRSEAGKAKQEETQ